MLLRKLIVGLCTGIVYTLFFPIAISIAEGDFGWGALGFASYVMFVADIFILTYGLLMSILIEWLVNKCQPKHTLPIKLGLYFLAGILALLILGDKVVMDWSRVWQQIHLIFLFPSVMCAILYFIIDEVFMRKQLLIQHKKSTIIVTILALICLWSPYIWGIVKTMMRTVSSLT